MQQEPTSLSVNNKAEWILPLILQNMQLHQRDLFSQLYWYSECQGGLFTVFSIKQYFHTSVSKVSVPVTKWQPWFFCKGLCLQYILCLALYQKKYFMITLAMKLPDRDVLYIHRSYSFFECVGQRFYVAPCTCHEVACDPENIICTSTLSVHPFIINVYSIIPPSYACWYSVDCVLLLFRT